MWMAAWPRITSECIKVSCFPSLPNFKSSKVWKTWNSPSMFHPYLSLCISVHLLIVTHASAHFMHAFLHSIMWCVQLLFVTRILLRLCWDGAISRSMALPGRCGPQSRIIALIGRQTWPQEPKRNSASLQTKSFKFKHSMLIILQSSYSIYLSHMNCFSRIAFADWAHICFSHRLIVPHALRLLSERIVFLSHSEKRLLCDREQICARSANAMREKQWMCERDTYALAQQTQRVRNNLV